MSLKMSGDGQEREAAIRLQGLPRLELIVLTMLMCVHARAHTHTHTHTATRHFKTALNIAPFT